MSDDCIFCKIASGAIPAKAVHRDEDVLAIEDVNPQAPVHLLVMPVRHHSNIAVLSDAGDGTLVGKLLEVASRLGRVRGGDGFRLVINTGPDGGQTVDHLHVHVLAGRHMTWPPG
ncbi:MAG TPA: histidine triad nucleotide-binding protein [Candidatus Baltobacteraceae bacterium]|nr:histidine triad nucleotide-binding protein [Candidatus Baltobacteraceae bacterium]